MAKISDDARGQLAAWKAQHPVVALMGEFSAGKSTLLNALMGADLLPTRATATRMPAVWLTAGPALQVYGLRYDGTLTQLAEDDLAHGALEDYLVLRIIDPSDALSDYDILDTPGISDIRLQDDVIQTLAGHVDLVIWCSNATQFWRQSEKAMWRALPRPLRDRSVLAVTGSDRLSKRDLTRVLRRGHKEAKGLFSAVLSIAALDAVTATDDDRTSAWETSGISDLIAHLDENLTALRHADKRPIAEDVLEPPIREDHAEIPDNTANADNHIYLDLRKNLQEITEISKDFRLSTLLKQLIATVDEHTELSDDDRNLVMQVLSLDDVTGSDAAKYLRQLDGELSDFSNGPWCQLA
ncbi:MAG: dynamin family protein [Pseudomonadota bacterium]